VDGLQEAPVSCGKNHHISKLISDQRLWYSPRKERSVETDDLMPQEDIWEREVK